MKNLQSAELAYKQLGEMQELLGKTTNSLETAQARLDAVEKAQEGNADRLKLAKAEERIKQLETENAQLYDINNKLFLKIGMPVDEKPQMDEEERAEKQQVDAIKEKLKQQHAEEAKINEQILKGE